MKKLISNAEILDFVINAQSLEEVIQEEQNAFFEETDKQRKLFYQIRISEAREMKKQFLTILN